MKVLLRTACGCERIDFIERSDPGAMLPEHVYVAIVEPIGYLEGRDCPVNINFRKRVFQYDHVESSRGGIPIYREVLEREKIEKEETKMLKVIRKDGLGEVALKDVMCLPDGTIFSGIMSADSGRRVYLKIYDGIVDLENPSCTYISRSCMYIKQYLELNGTLTVERKEFGC